MAGGSCVRSREIDCRRSHEIQCLRCREITHHLPRAPGPTTWTSRTIRRYAPTMPDVFTGRAQLGVLGNNARVHMTAGLNLAAAAIPYEMGGFDADSGSEFMNHEVMHW